MARLYTHATPNTTQKNGYVATPVTSYINMFLLDIMDKTHRETVVASGTVVSEQVEDVECHNVRG